MFRKYFFQLLAVPALLLLGGLAFGQTSEDTGWQLLSPAGDQVNGTGVEQAYQMVRDRSSNTVVVAIIDSGVDVDHEDLKDNIWINEDEIPENGKDDDDNGYVDDMHGWNFLGNADGENVSAETLEITRLYAKYRDYFKDKDLSKLKKKDKQLYEVYQEYKKVVEKERGKAQATLATIEANEAALLGAIDEFKKKYPDQELTKSFMTDFDPESNDKLQIIRQMFNQVQEYEAEISSIEEIENDIIVGYAEAKKSFREKTEYWYNPDFNSREIIGDDYSNSYEKGYGNPDVIGEHNFHGTHVAGIVGAVRGNDTGVKGIVENVQLMVLRAVPDGDEHDKDIANAILYAVDNGANVINMSFGKGQSWDKVAVDKAVKHAMKNDVLIVHAAGNDAEDNDETMHFPVPEYQKSGLFGKKMAENWIEVGALNPEMGENAVASFSNYGNKSVDVFAPGGQIMSTAPGNEYQPASGTSMASPVVAGVAALIRSYYPTLTAGQVKEVIVKSAMPYDGQVRMPGSGELVNMSELCNTGGIIDAEKAIELASQTKGKKKIKGDKNGDIQA